MERIIGLEPPVELAAVEGLPIDVVVVIADVLSASCYDIEVLSNAIEDMDLVFGREFIRLTDIFLDDDLRLYFRVMALNCLLTVISFQPFPEFRSRFFDIEFGFVFDDEIKGTGVRALHDEAFRQSVEVYLIEGVIDSVARDEDVFESFFRYVVPGSGPSGRFDDQRVLRVIVEP